MLISGSLGTYTCILLDNDNKVHFTRRTLRSSRKNTSNEAIEKEPSRISLRNRTVDRSSFFNQSSKSTNPNIKDKDNQSLIKHNNQNKDKKLLYKQIIQDRPDLPRN